MLWTDSIFVSAADLVTIDGEASVVSLNENVPIDGINGSAQRSLEEAGRDLLMHMQNWSGFLAGNSLSANHLQAVFNIGLPAVQRTRVLLDNVVISGQNDYLWSEIKTWCVFKALANFYRNVSARVSDDRYSDKAKNYTKIAKWESWPQLMAAGIPVVYKPLACPAAFMGRNPGTWTLSEAASAGAVGGQLDVAISYWDSTKSTNNESNISARQTVTADPNFAAKADITRLNPPNGVGNVKDIARAIVVPLTATHWNIYAGPSGGVLTLQNISPIAIATKTYTLTGDPTTTGAVAGAGQWVDQYLTVQNMLFRG